MSAEAGGGRPTETLTSDERGQVRTEVGGGPAGTGAAAGVRADLHAGAAVRFAERYRRVGVLGEGGMGRVDGCRDLRIGREVAMKVVRPGVGSQPDREQRFLREAQIQGQLEHPAVVPVYDLDVEPGGALFMSMKRLRGATLAEVLDGLRAGDPSVAARFTRRKLLNAFGQVCLAIDFAHAKGVVHRDLKPANVMLGEFGEVYLLDWGVAKVLGEAELAGGVGLPTEAGTAVGSLVGTPGYMAPEQVHGDPAALDGRADVYALGALLFELLTLGPLHVARSTTALLAGTLAGADARASVRAPDRDLPPELDTLCVRATALQPADRYPTARALHEALERFLEGDRDLELRRKLAETHAAAAAQVAGRAPTADEQAPALRQVGRALALDPDNRLARATLLRLLTDPPRELPPAVAEELAAANRRARVSACRAAAGVYFGVALILPMMLWMGVRSWSLTHVGAITWLAAGGAYLVAARRPLPGGEPPYWLIALSNLALLATVPFFGPLVATPGAAAVNTLTLLLVPTPARRRVVVAAGCVPVLFPLALAWLGWVPAFYQFNAGRMIVLPQLVSFPAAPAMLFLIVCAVSLIVICALLFMRHQDQLSAAERQQQLQAWKLRQLVSAQP